MGKGIIPCKKVVMDRAVTRITLISLQISGYLPNYPRISKIKLIMEVVEYRGRIILSYPWAKSQKWKNLSMMNTVDGPKSLQVQQTKVGIRHRVETIKASRICMQIKAATSIILIQLRTREITLEEGHQKIIILQKKRRRTCFSTHKERAEQHSIALRMSLLS